jgi:uncharacterized membrane protein YdcZ (DUF606 family)
MNPLFLALAFVAGTAIAAQAAVNSQLAAGLGGQPITAAFVSFMVGTVVLGAIAAATGSLSSIGHPIGARVSTSTITTSAGEWSICQSAFGRSSRKAPGRMVWASAAPLPWRLAATTLRLSL